MEYSDVLNNEFNSQFIKTFSYKGNTYIKAMEISKNDYNYRYFLITDNSLEEVTDLTLLAYFNETEGFSSDLVF